MADFKIDIAYSKFDGIKALVAKSNTFQFKRFLWKNHMIYYSQKFCTERIFDTILKFSFWCSLLQDLCSPFSNFLFAL